MVALTVTQLHDLCRVRVTITDPTPNVVYELQRSTDGGQTWVDVRGGGNMGTTGVLFVDDYEYAPNQENLYRVTEPVFFDSFNRVYPVGAALQLSGNSGSYASAPDSAALDITGDIDIMFDGTLDLWFGEQRGLVGKWVFSGNQRSYLLTIESDGRLGFRYSDDGAATAFTALSTESVPIESGRLAVRVQFDVSVGQVTFFTSPLYTSDLTSAWTQLGNVVQGVIVGSIFVGTAPLEVGSFDLGTKGVLNGLVHRVVVKPNLGLGSHAANPDFNQQTPGAPSFVDGVGNTWTINGDAELIEYGPINGFDWGTADTGQEWSVGGTSPGLITWVDGVGVIGSTQPTGRLTEQITDPIPGMENGEVTWSAIYPGSRELFDEEIEWAVGLRRTGFADDYYESNLRFLTEADGYGVELRIGKFLDDDFMALGTVVVGTWSTAVPWHARFRVEGSNLFARAWRDDQAEPTNWDLFVTDTDITGGQSITVRSYRSGGSAFMQWFGPIEAHTIPDASIALASITPEQTEVCLKSVTYPMLNCVLDCVDWDAMSRDSRAGFFDVKGRHEILAITDVGSSASFNLTFVTQSADEARAVRALLTYGGILYLQPPGDTDEECQHGTFSGLPDGFVMWDGSVERHSVRGTPIEQWTVGFTRVAGVDVAGVVGTTITWEMLWSMIGVNGTWQTVWNTWPHWQAIWAEVGDFSAFNGGVTL